MEAQQAILDKVAATYGGIARDIASTDTGKLTQIQNVWGDIKEGLGNGLVSALSPALDWLFKQLNKISSWINDLNAEREMASDIMADSSGEKAGNKYSSDTINKYLKEYDKETANAYQTLLSMIPKVDNNGKTIDAPTTIEELKAIFGNSYANEMGVETGLSGAEEAWNFFQSAKNKSSAALKARDIAVAKESAHAVDAYSSSSESVGSSGAVSGVKVQTIDEYI
ncbi:MAG: hypothetical protein GXZ16_08100 [Spirochaetales bacterium]|nr:hypothetical protein [Spirochaetales bacterium]